MAIKKSIEARSVSIEAGSVEVEKKMRLTPKEKQRLITMSRNIETGVECSYRDRDDYQTLSDIQLCEKRAPTKTKITELDAEIKTVWRRLQFQAKTMDLQMVKEAVDDIQDLRDKKKEERYFITAQGLEYLDKGKVVIIV